jgi:hypothetical protein
VIRGVEVRIYSVVVRERNTLLNESINQSINQSTDRLSGRLTSSIRSRGATRLSPLRVVVLALEPLFAVAHSQHEQVPLVPSPDP